MTPLINKIRPPEDFGVSDAAWQRRKVKLFFPRIFIGTPVVLNRNASKRESFPCTVELQGRNADLERFNQVMVGREWRMVELKKEIKTLRTQLDRMALAHPRPDFIILDIQLIRCLSWTRFVISFNRNNKELRRTRMVGYFLSLENK